MKCIHCGKGPIVKDDFGMITCFICGKGQRAKKVEA